MIGFRKLMGSVFGLIAALLLCLAIAEVLAWRGVVEHTIENAREIKQAFGQASVFVDGFIQSHNRLPTEQEFSAWTSTQPEGVHSARTFQLLTSPSQFADDEIVKKFGPPAPNSYLLKYWRGEWFEYYASWAKASTLELNPKSFYFFGRPIADGIVLLSLGLLFAAFAKGAWPPPNPSFQRTAAGARLARTLGIN